MFNIASRHICSTFGRRSVDSSRVLLEHKSALCVLLKLANNHSVSSKCSDVGSSQSSTRGISSFRKNYYEQNSESNGYGSVKSNILQALLAAGVVMYGTKKYLKVQKAHCLVDDQKQVDESPEDVTNTVKKHNEADVVQTKFKDWKINLYQYQTCPFCCKARSFLQLHNIPFEMVEVHPIFKSEIKFSEYKKVPIITLEDPDGHITQINDSSLIISALSSFIINDEVSLADTLEKYPWTVEIDDKGKEKKTIMNRHYVSTVRQDYAPEVESRIKEEAKWRAWVDDYLVHLISPNVYRTMYESYQAFDYHVSQGKFQGTWEGTVAKYGGAIAMYGVSKILKKRHELHDNVRLDLYKACNYWVSEIGKGNKFMGGDKPNLADVSVYGVLSVMENLAVWDDLISHSKIKKWYYRTKKFVENHDGRNLFEDVDS